MNDSSLKFKIYIFIAFLFLGLLYGKGATAASLYLSPASGTFNRGENFIIAVKLNSGGQSINAAEGTIVFNPDTFSVIGISKSGSIFNLWTMEPSALGGSINFGGGATSGYNGSGGSIIVITFQAKANGKYDIDFSSGSVLASDGKGTNILSSMVSGSYNIEPKKTSAASESAEYAPPKNAPSEAEIISITHSEQDAWYQNNNPNFSWILPKDATGVRMSADHNSGSFPTKYYQGAITEKKIENVGDGEWYFHLAICNKSGCGKAAHYKFQIDASKPEAFSVKAQDGEKTTNTQPVISFEAKDAISGIDYYQIKIGDENWIDTKEATYKLPAQIWGKHTVLVKAIDRSGNNNLSATEIEIIPLKAPSITVYPNEVTTGSYFSIKGNSLPDSTVKIYIGKEDKIEEDSVTSDKDGAWSYTYNKSAKVGMYQIWTETADANGGKSNASNKISITANSPAYLRIGKLAIDYLSISLVLLALLFTVVLFIIWAYEKIKHRLDKAMRKTTKAEKTLFRAFSHLKKEVEKEIAKIDGDPRMSRREKETIKNMETAISTAEKFIVKEIKDIEDELK